MTTQTMTIAKHMNIYDSLHTLMRSANSDFGFAQAELMNDLQEYCTEGLENDSQKLIGSMILKALSKKLYGNSENDHLYLKQFEISQIELFNILIEKFPFVKYSQKIVNDAIVRSMDAAEVVTLMDVGIGQGTQMLNVIESAKSLTELKKLHIIGIEPFTEALLNADENINAMRSQVHFEIEFTPINAFAEQVDFEKLNKKIEGRLIVNASLALHHLQTSAQRDEVLAAIHKLNPAALLMIEPNVNHYETDYAKRFVNCYNHYYSIFKVIDGLDISNQDKNALKVFFGREIDDVMGKSETDRYEKHELANTWISRLHQKGFRIMPEMLRTPVSSEAGVRIGHHHEGYLGFTYEKETVLAVIYAI